MMGCMLLPQALWAQQAVDDSPNEFAMVGDLLVARPIGVVMTIGGAAVWLVSLPFTLLAGHASEAAETLIWGPVELLSCVAWVAVTRVYRQGQRAHQDRKSERCEEQPSRLKLAARLPGD